MLFDEGLGPFNFNLLGDECVDDSPRIATATAFAFGFVQLVLMANDRQEIREHKVSPLFTKLLRCIEFRLRNRNRRKRFERQHFKQQLLVRRGDESFSPCSKQSLLQECDLFVGGIECLRKVEMVARCSSMIIRCPAITRSCSITCASNCARRAKTAARSADELP